MINTSSFFDSFCKNAKHNAVIIMDTDGIIVQINQAFTTSFGYDPEDILQKSFSVLFTEEDKKKNKPELELQMVITQGSGSDDNYIVQKSGKFNWVNGESVLVTGEDGTRNIIKIIHNIEAQKQLERFLVESNDFIETILESITDRGLMILDKELKIIKVNGKFVEMFNLPGYPAEGSRLSGVDNPFWKSNEVKQLLRDVVVKDQLFQKVKIAYSFHEDIRMIELSSKFLHSFTETRILLVTQLLKE